MRDGSFHQPSLRLLRRTSLPAEVMRQKSRKQASTQRVRLYDYRNTILMQLKNKIRYKNDTI